MSFLPRPRSLSSLGRAWFPFLFWSLWDFRAGDPSRLPSDLQEALGRGRHSIRMLRYWWAIEALRDEARRLGRPPVVLDLGCGRGWLRQLAEGRVEAIWIGLDGKLDAAALQGAGYAQLHEVDFHQRLPLATAEADVVISLHVFEHLHNPDAAMAEVRRVLKPDGLFLGGTPTMPAPLAVLRTAWHQFRHAIGRPGWNGHARSFSPATWERLLQRQGFQTQFLTGSHWVRLSGHRLESSWLWVRLNQFLGALIPSLGSEVYLAARRSEHRAPRPSAVLRKVWALGDWAVPAGLAVVLGFTVLSGSPREEVLDWLADHRDSDDVYVLCAQADAVSELRLGLQEVRGPQCGDLQRFRHNDPRADHHVLVEWQDAPTWLAGEGALAWRVVDQLEAKAGRLVLLSQREDGLAQHQVRW